MAGPMRGPMAVRNTTKLLFLQGGMLFLVVSIVAR